jgi:hypothetical protein
MCKYITILAFYFLGLFPCMAQLKRTMHEEKIKVNNDIFKPLTPAQSTVKSHNHHPTIGVHGGSMISIFTLNGENSHATGTSAGVFFNFPIAERWSIRPEINGQSRRVNYTQTKIANNPIGEYSEFTGSYKYVDIPILLQYNVRDRFSYYFGGQLGKNVHSGYRTKYQEKIYVEQNEVNDIYKGFSEMSAVIGAEYRLKCGFAVELRYPRTMQTFNNGDSYSQPRFSILQLGLQYKFHHN